MPLSLIDREKIIKYSNEHDLLTYMVRSTTINSYLKSLLNLAALLTCYAIFPSAADEISDEGTDMIRAYAEELVQLTFSQQLYMQHSQHTVQISYKPDPKRYILHI